MGGSILYTELIRTTKYLVIVHKDVVEQVEEQNYPSHLHKHICVNTSAPIYNEIQ
jgi:hypothetical protein